MVIVPVFVQKFFSLEWCFLWLVAFKGEFDETDLSVYKGFWGRVLVHLMSYTLSGGVEVCEGAWCRILKTGFRKR